ncbi:MAG: GGDEF domain-containing protein [Rubrivivax sp.]|nr:GGDEF domain-containing protein [Rubrivivax sp.]
MSSPPADRDVKPTSGAVRLGRQAWRALHLDSARSLALAERALALAHARGDSEGEAWARLARGFHRLYFASPDEAADDLRGASAGFAALGDRAGEILARAGIARADWRSGRVQQALQQLLPLRDEGLALLRHEQRGVLLNAIAGCYSAQGRSDLAFAYMFEALRDAGPRRGHGFDAVLHCNLSHELLQLGDHDEALAQVERGLARCAGLANTKLLSVLLINRVLSLTETGRAREALDSVHALAAQPLGSGGRGTRALHFETLAIAALRAGETALGAQLLAQARDSGHLALPDERVELAVAEALAAAAQGDARRGLAALDAVAALVAGHEAEDADRAAAADDRASLRVRCLHAQVASELHEALGDSAAALQAVRRWQRLNAERAGHASRARYQAAVLQTELLTLQHALAEQQARRRATERARAALAEANEALSRKVAEVEALQAALREQATHDALTGLANRRHLNDMLPRLLAMALREREPLAVVLVDLDRFKAVNDQHGHGAGDLLLAAFGRLLREQLRGSDLAFRYGGEEFCLLLPNTPADDAAHKLRELLQRWHEQVFVLEGTTLRAQGFSAGVTDTLQSAPSPDALLSGADARLLAAKRAGRHRVVAGPPAAQRA